MQCNIGWQENHLINKCGNMSSILPCHHLRAFTNKEWSGGLQISYWLKELTPYFIIPHQLKPFPLTNFHASETQSQHAIFN